MILLDLPVGTFVNFVYANKIRYGVIHRVDQNRRLITLDVRCEIGPDDCVHNVGFKTFHADACGYVHVGSGVAV